MVCKQRKAAVLGLNESPVNDSLFNLLYVHGAPHFFQDNLNKKDK